MKIINKTW